MTYLSHSLGNVAKDGRDMYLVLVLLCENLVVVLVVVYRSLLPQMPPASPIEDRGTAIPIEPRGSPRRVTSTKDHSARGTVGAGVDWTSFAKDSFSRYMNLISSVPRRKRFGLATSRPFLSFQVLFFVAARLMPLISEPPDMTWISLVEVARREQLQWASRTSLCLDSSWPSRKGIPGGIRS
ncbi:hypothetical protein F2Q68_00005039 [Brassica cretica]|uniref:Uncharacterized protein n=1 Tax=Brassica cretica TaxID=69181 RepID=A0A8S9J471_BRACR|nr:hypothetical protein F2Q68_00005039 [Brassica cretica]